MTKQKINITDELLEEIENEIVETTKARAKELLRVVQSCSRSLRYRRADMIKIQERIDAASSCILKAYTECDDDALNSIAKDVLPNIGI